MSRTTVAQRRTRNILLACAGSFGAGVALTLYVDGSLLALANMILTHWATIVWVTVAAAVSYRLISATLVAFGTVITEYFETRDNPNITWKLWK